MRLNGLSAAVLCLLTASTIRPVAAGLVPEFLEALEDLQNVAKRCANPCGYYGQVCCSSNQYCYTDSNGEAQCGTGSGVSTATVAGSWTYYTTTYVQTDLQTITATFSSYIPAQTTAAPAQATCSYSLGQTQCGNACCNSGQYCEQAGSCVDVPGSSGYYSSLYTVTTVVTNTASAPLRPTSGTVATVTATGTGSTTVPFQTPVGTGGAVLTGYNVSSGGGLSGGAIAGIVIGVIAGIILLLLLCACCCFKGLLDGLLAIFGLGPRRRRRVEETEIIEERHHHSGGGGGRRTWFGTRPNRTTEVIEEKKTKTSGWGNIAAVGGLLGGLAIILGLKRRRDRERDDKTDVSYSYDSYYDYTSSSSESSRGHTRASRASRTNRSRSRSRVSRGTRL